MAREGNNTTKNNRVSRFMIFPLFNIASTPVLVQALTPLFNAGSESTAHQNDVGCHALVRQETFFVR